MASPSRGAEVAVGQAAPGRWAQRSLAEVLFAEGWRFDFFQAVRVLGRLAPERVPVGLAGPPEAEAVRFRAHLSLSFPPSSIYEVEPPSPVCPAPGMTVAFLGLTGPSGVLPEHYTELLLRLQREVKGPSRRALRDWLDLFNHRLVSLFYRAWEKYRFYLHYERGVHDPSDPDEFTRAVCGLVGLGTPGLRGRLVVSSGTSGQVEAGQVLARVDDLALFYYSGLLAHQPRCAVGLEQLLADYFQLPVEVLSYQGQWLALEPDNQSRLGDPSGNGVLGVNVVVGDRVWDVQSKVRIRIGPLTHPRFLEFLPGVDGAGRTAFFLLCQLVRLYIGPEFDYDVQLVLKAAEVPLCRLPEGDEDGPQLGWNAWVGSEPFREDAGDAVFVGQEAAGAMGW